jgi:hypothetical protein
MQFDWPAKIVKLVRWKEIAHTFDKAGALPWHLPNVAAAEEQVAAAESATGTKFPTPYKRFLCHADGWRGFLITIDLFGTRDFISGRVTDLLKRAELRDFIGSLPNSGEILPIGASEFDLDVFLLVSAGSSIGPGQIIWFANEEVERFGDFEEFFTAVIDYNARGAAKLRSANEIKH